MAPKRFGRLLFTTVAVGAIMVCIIQIWPLTLNTSPRENEHFSPEKEAFEMGEWHITGENKFFPGKNGRTPGRNEQFSGENAQFPDSHVGLSPEELNHSIFSETCRVPLLLPFDSSLKGIFSIDEKLPKSGMDKPPLFVINDTDNTIRVDRITRSIYYHGISNCSLTEFSMNSDFHLDLKRNVHLQTLSFSQSKKVIGDLITVHCFSGKQTTYSQYNALVQRKDVLEKERREKHKLWKAKEKPKEVLNIIIVLTDTTSRLNFARFCPQTTKYLLGDLEGFEMLGFNKVGLNTYPNLLALFTGITDLKLKQRGHIDPMEMDSPKVQPPLSFIWDVFQEAGYLTLTTEDWPRYGQFHSLCSRGFIRQPTDYYWSALELPVRNGTWYRPEVNINAQLSFAKAFIRKYKAIPKLTIIMNAVVTHNHPELLSKFDPIYLNFTRTLKDEGHLNDSLLIFMGDHGPRFGKIRQTVIGMMEDRMPQMTMILPKWFLHKYPRINRALKVNTRRLATPFDMRATFLSMLPFTGKVSREETPNRGHSLFGVLSNGRSCEKVGIPEEFCSCNTYYPMSTDDHRIQKGAAISLDFINSLLTPVKNKCHFFTLSNITDARLGYKTLTESKNILNLETMNKTEIYLLTFAVNPGRMVFEASVRYGVLNQSYSLVGIPVQITRYKEIPECVSDEIIYILRDYCLCK